MEYRFLHNVPIPQVLYDDALEERQGHAGVPDALRIHHEDGPRSAYAQAGRFSALHPPCSKQQSLALQQSRELCVDPPSVPAWGAEAPDADKHMAGIWLHLRRLRQAELRHGESGFCMRSESNGRGSEMTTAIAQRRTPPKVHRVTTPHRTSFHLDSIVAGPPGGAPVLCLPGLFAGSWVFERLLPLIASRGHHASAISYRGHPPLATRRDIGRQSVADFAEDAADAARSLDRPIVIAHSLGGLVALLLAQRRLIRAAVLLSPAPPSGINVLSAEILSRMVKYLPALLMSRAYQPTGADADALVLNRVRESEREAIRLRFVPDSGRASREIALGKYHIPSDSIRIPLLVVGSDDDRFIPLGVSRRIAERYSAPLHVAEGHGHFLLSEPGWERQAEVMLDWIDALPPALRGEGVGANSTYPE